MEDNKEAHHQLIWDLETEHRDLDEVVAKLSTDPDVDQIMLRRLKQKKLRLKDQIARMKSALIPDLNA